jgi:ABC-type phosphate/phosphonate transport system substrate-binding protein
MSFHIHKNFWLGLSLALVCASAGAEPATTLQKTALTPARAMGVALAGPGDKLVFTAAPRESEKEGREIYGPIAEYLSKVTGKNVIYQHPGTWGVYRTAMLKGEYDLIFDGPHFNSYRVEKLAHSILVKIPATLDFVIVVRKDAKFTSAQNLAGRTVCSHAPPNLGALVLLNQFDNPARQPSILPVEGWNEVFEGVRDGKCVGGVMPVAQMKKLDTGGALRVLYQSHKIPNQAISASPRISTEDQMKIAQALVAPEAAVPTAKLRAAFKIGDSLTVTNNQEYAGLADYLRNEWGYY